MKFLLVLSSVPDLGGGGGLQGRKSLRKARKMGVQKFWLSGDRGGGGGGAFKGREQAYTYPK